MAITISGMRVIDETLIAEAGRRLAAAAPESQADVIVISREYAERWREVRGGLVHAALSQGRVLAG